MLEIELISRHVKIPTMRRPSVFRFSRAYRCTFAALRLTGLYNRQENGQPGNKQLIKSSFALDSFRVLFVKEKTSWFFAL